MNWLFEILDCFPLISASRYNLALSANDHLNCLLIEERKKHREDLEEQVVTFHSRLKEVEAKHKEELHRVTEQVRRIADKCWDIKYRRSSKSRIYSICVDLDYEMMHPFNNYREDMGYIADAVCTRLRSDIMTCKFVQLAKDERL